MTIGNIPASVGFSKSLVPTLGEHRRPLPFANVRQFLRALFGMLALHIPGTLLAADVSYALALGQGWNLVGNSLTTAIDVASVYGDAKKFNSVWKWDATAGRWLFYSPSLAADGSLASYAAQQGYGVFTGIGGGEGYWVNAVVATTLPSFSGPLWSLARTGLTKGWNQIATGSDVGPAEFSRSLTGSGSPALNAVWAWDNPLGKWYFYAPSLEASGELAAYNADHGYLDFGSRALGQGRGFWVSSSSDLIAGRATTDKGVVEGNAYSGGWEYLGIPFAQAPLGARRWTAPQEPVPWSTVMKTQAFRPECPQKRFEQGEDSYQFVGDEDCLYLNVWTPGNTAPQRPVLVFIHGGGSQQGSASQITGGTQIFSGKNLAALGNAVVVTIQYRLGPLGYLVHKGLEQESPSASSGNYGVLDQIQALKWVQRNIAAFGGDPQRVLVFGESAGGLSVGNLLLTPMAAGLFQRAGIESAIPMLATRESALASGTAFADKLSSGPSDLDRIAQLRLVDWRTLVADNQNPTKGGLVQMAWGPVVDGWLFASDPTTAFARGDFNRMPLLIGSNADEMSLSAPPTVSPGMVDALITASVPRAYRDQARSLYPSGVTPAQARTAYVQLLTDGQFTAGVRRTARSVARSGQPVYRYFFTHAHSGPLGTYGSYHGIELFYVFNTWEDTPYARGGFFSDDDRAVQERMLKFWVNFAASGDPNGLGLPSWQRFSPTQDWYMQISAGGDGNNIGVRTEKSDFWDSVAEAK